MEKRRYLVEQVEAPITILETMIEDVQVNKQDVDTITLKFILQNKMCFSKTFYKYGWDYMDNWKNKKSGDPVSLKIKAGIIIDICSISKLI